MNSSRIRSNWAAVGAAVAVSLGAGGIGITHATTSSGDKPVYIPLDEPCRLADNRPAGIGPSTSVTFDGWGMVGDCDLPTGTAGLALNVTAVDATQQTNLRFYPADVAVPGTANLNPAPGAPPIPNAVNVALDATGKFKVFNSFGTVAVVIDVMGVYDDHNHDDRYYTEDEVDAALAAARPLAVHAQAAETPVSADLVGTIVVSASIDVTAAGTIIATGFASLTESDGDETGCGVFLAPDTFDGGLANFFEPTAGAFLNGTVGTARHFDVSAGSHTVNLICRTTGGAGSSTSRSELSLLFLPS